MGIAGIEGGAFGHDVNLSPLVTRTRAYLDTASIYRLLVLARGQVGLGIDSTLCRQTRSASFSGSSLANDYCLGVGILQQAIGDSIERALGIVVHPGIVFLVGDLGQLAGNRLLRRSLHVD